MYTAVIIDDEKWIIKSLTALLQNQQFFEIIGEAYNGPSGLDLILEKRPDLAFVDIRMPGMGGLELLQGATLQGSKTIFVIISGHAEFAYVQKAMTQNAIAYCLKPFSPTEIQESVEKTYQMLQEREKYQLSEIAPIKECAYPTKNRIVRQMLDYIHSHFQETISIQQIAQHCNVNPNYASQLFNQEMNQTFSSYLTDLRIKKAVKLLQTTDYPVAEIAAQIGYRDYFYFAKVFKKIMGTTPSTYRNTEDLL